MRLTPPSEELLRELLAWDRARVAKIAKRGYDCSVYQARQDAAEAALGEPPATWPNEVRELFQTVLEATRVGDQVKVRNIGYMRAPKLAPGRKPTYRMAAIEIGVLEKFMEVAPALWSEEGSR